MSGLVVEMMVAYTRYYNRGQDIKAHDIYEFIQHDDDRGGMVYTRRGDAYRMLATHLHLCLGPS